MRVLIVGGGTVGKILIKNLAEKSEVTVIEKNKETADKIAESFDVEVIHGNALEGELLEKITEKTYDVALITTKNTSTNIMVSLLLKTMGVKKIICRVKTTTFSTLLKDLGIDSFSESELISLEFINRTFNPLKSMFIKTNSPTIYEEEGKKFAGKKVIELLKEGIIIVSVYRENTFLYPEKDLEIEEKDKLLIVSR